MATVAEPYRQLEFIGETGDAADVIGMFVCDHDGAQVRWIKREPAQAGDSLLDTKAAIEQDSGLPHFHDQGIAFAAAPQTGKAHCVLFQLFIEQVENFIRRFRFIRYPVFLLAR